MVIFIVGSRRKKSYGVSRQSYELASLYLGTEFMPLQQYCKRFSALGIPYCNVAPGEAKPAVGPGYVWHLTPIRHDVNASDIAVYTLGLRLFCVL